MRIKPVITPPVDDLLPAFPDLRLFSENDHPDPFRDGSDLKGPFERFLCRIATTLLGITAAERDRQIPLILEQVRQLFHCAFCGLSTLGEDDNGLIKNYRAGTLMVPENLTLSQTFPWMEERLRSGEQIWVTSGNQLPAEAATDRRTLQEYGIEAMATLPILIAGRVQFAMVAFYNHLPRTMLPALLPRLRLVGEIIASNLARCRLEAALQESWLDSQCLQKQLAEAEYIQSDQTPCQTHHEVVGQSQVIARTLALTEQVAPTDSTVLIYGETGTGKELIAQDIHKLSSRRHKQMVKVNCASLPAALVESELFGRERGAYTGALTRQAGRFELADGGTIFLDEIAEMSLELQAKLLRVLQEGQFERLGGTKTIQVNVRVIAATNRNLSEEVKKGTFREDLFYRLNVFQIVVPPLRERAEDIPLLVWSFVNEFAEKMGKRFNKIAKQDMAALQGYQWPGNVRELRNVIEHAAIVSTGDTLQIRVPEKNTQENPGIRTLEEYEIMHIREALRLTGGRIKGDRGAARLLGLNPSTLYSRMQKLGISNRPAKDDMSS